MKAVIVSSSYSYLERTDLLKEAYENQGYDVVVIMTDFIHAKKEFSEEKKEGYIYIPTKPYYKNISVGRLYSHYWFAKDAFREIRRIQMDVLHVLIPANSLAREADKYKKAYPNVKLYFDFIDLWPETMPIRKFKSALPFKFWKNQRDKHLRRTDKIYCECDLYKEVLQVVGNEHYQTLYWAKKSDGLESHPNLSDTQINLCYLGSVNNIIDMDKIAEICKKIGKYKEVTLHLIANGEKKKEFVELLQLEGICIQDHGAVYNDEEKQKIFDQCHFGLNIMKPTVCVGLTMKSLDYFRAHLPIINNIQGDTYCFVNKYRVGFNEDTDYAEIIKGMEMDDYLEMRCNAQELYKKKFSKEAFLRTLKRSV